MLPIRVRIPLVHQLVTRCHGWQSIFNTVLQKSVAFVFSSHHTDWKMSRRGRKPSLEDTEESGEAGMWLCCSFQRIKWTFLANVNVSLYAVARPSVVCLSVCRLSSVTLVHPTQAVQLFGNISTAFGTLAIRWHPLKISRRSPRGTPPPGELNTRGVVKYSDFGPIDGYISETLQDRRQVSINHL